MFNKIKQYLALEKNVFRNLSISERIMYTMIGALISLLLFLLASLFYIVVVEVPLQAIVAILSLPIFYLIGRHVLKLLD